MPDAIVIGGGASGALASAQLLLRGAEVTLLEPAAELGRGMAYSTKCPLHLLNVRAASMSAFPDDADHFLRWLERTRPGQFGACSFVPRSVYGEYIRSVLEDAVRGTSSKFRHLRTRAIAARVAPAGIAIETEDSGLVHGDALILATGNAAPAGWPGLSPEIAASGRYFNLAWTEGAFDLRDHDSPVLLLGSGLTAVDALLALRHQGHHGQVYMVSRRGLLPQAHVLPVHHSMPSAPFAGMRGLVRDMRAAASQTAAFPATWREVVDSIRPETNRIWQALGCEEQRRFLRHVRPFWDTHRHRMAPQIGEVVHDSLRDGSLHVIAGRTRGFQLRRDCVEVSIALRGRAATRRLQVHRIVNCTGSETDLSRTANPVLRDLIEQGWLQSDPHRLGTRVNDDGALSSAHGGSAPIYTLGPLRMGTLFESIAMPEIRVQAHNLANLLMSGRTAHRSRTLV